MLLFILLLVKLIKVVFFYIFFIVPTITGELKMNTQL